MHRGPLMNSALGLRRFNRFNYGDFGRDDRFRRSHRFNKIIFIRNVGFPWGPWLGWNWGYYPRGPYEYSDYSYPSDYPSYYSSYGYGYGNYGYGYAYGYPTLLYYGGYYSATNYENDESIVRNVLAEYTVSWNRHDTAALGRLFDENCEYVDMAGVTPGARKKGDEKKLLLPTVWGRYMASLVRMELELLRKRTLPVF